MYVSAQNECIWKRIWWNYTCIYIYIYIYLIKDYEFSTNVYDNKILKDGSQFICLSVILIDSVSRTGENYYPQVFLEECKYVVKEWRKLNSDEENSDGKN